MGIIAKSGDAHMTAVVLMPKVEDAKVNNRAS